MDNMDVFVCLFICFWMRLEILSKTFRWIVIREIERPYASNLLISNPMPYTLMLDAKQSSDCGSSFFSTSSDFHCFSIDFTAIALYSGARNDYHDVWIFKTIPQKKKTKTYTIEMHFFSVRCFVLAFGSIWTLLCFAASITFEYRTISLSEYIFNQFWEHFYLFFTLYTHVSFGGFIFSRINTNSQSVARESILFFRCLSPPHSSIVGLFSFTSLYGCLRFHFILCLFDVLCFALMYLSVSCHTFVSFFLTAWVEMCIVECKSAINIQSW